MFTDFKKVDVWLGSFASERALEMYLEETYEDAGSAPISAFAADQGEIFYDHDFIEASFFTQTAEVIVQLREHSFADRLADEVAARLRDAEIGPVNTILLMWGEEIADPRSVCGADYELHYIGRFGITTGD